MGKKCISCNNELADDHRFCWRCGQRVFVGVNIPGVEVNRIIFCSHCGREHPEAARFCMECGKGLVDEETKKRATERDALPQNAEDGEFVELIEGDEVVFEETVDAAEQKKLVENANNAAMNIASSNATTPASVVTNVSHSLSAATTAQKGQNAQSHPSQTSPTQMTQSTRANAPDGESLVEDVAKALADPNSGLHDKKIIVNSLGQPPYSLFKVKALENVMTNKEAQLRECAVRALGKIGAVDGNLAKPSITILASATTDGDKFTRIEALKSLCSISEVSKTCSQESAKAVISALNDTDAGVRYRAILVMGSIFPYAPLFFKDALGALEKIRDSDSMQINKTEAVSVVEKLKVSLDEIARSAEKDVPVEVEPLASFEIVGNAQNAPQSQPQDEQSHKSFVGRFKARKKEK